MFLFIELWFPIDRILKKLAHIIRTLHLYQAQRKKLISVLIECYALPLPVTG